MAGIKRLQFLFDRHPWLNLLNLQIPSLRREQPPLSDYRGQPPTRLDRKVPGRSWRVLPTPSTGQFPRDLTPDIRRHYTTTRYRPASPERFAPPAAKQAPDQWPGSAHGPDYPPVPDCGPPLAIAAPDYDPG